MYNKTSLIVGPPGTGKTTYALNIVEEFFLDDIAPERIAYIAFTRKAAHEARLRAQGQFHLAEEQLRYFRTLHSLAFQELGIRRNEVMGIEDMLNIAKLLGLSISIKAVSEDGTLTGFTKGDRLLFYENLSRVNMVSLADQFNRLAGEDLMWLELERLHNTLNEYKKNHDKVDFTDMITRWIDVKPTLDIDKLIVDEAQDLSPVQWAMVEIIAKNVNEVFLVGDDDQAIFRWAGADIHHFLALPHRVRDTHVLEQSYRLPKKIQTLANKIGERIKERVPKTYYPRDEEGEIKYYTDVSQVDMSDGTWFCLARNTAFLDEFNQHCIRNGYVYESRTGSQIKPSVLRAIVSWEKLRRHEKVSLADVGKIYEFLSVNKGVKHGFKTKLRYGSPEKLVTLYTLQENYGLLTTKIWHEALDKVPDIQREYFIAALKRGEKLTTEPRIKVNTIHAVKGGEADNVCVCSDMAYRTWTEYQKNPDDEWRVWYVAVTRARQTLHVIQPRSQLGIIIPKVNEGIHSHPIDKQDI